MKKFCFVFLTLALLISVGCTTEKVSTEDNVKFHKEYHVFQGQSENWEGKITVDYTETFTEIDGKWKYDSQMNEGSKGYLRYKGSDVDSVRNLSFEVINGAYKQGGSRGKLYQSNEIELGTDIYRSDDIFTVTIEWNGLEENFQMKAIESKITD